MKVQRKAGFILSKFSVSGSVGLIANYADRIVVRTHMLEISQIEPNVDLIKLSGKEIYLIGTAHISQSSVELAERIIRQIQPDSVAVELCDSRYESLKDPERWKKTDIFSVIKSGKTYLLLAQLLLSGFQRKLGSQFQVKPGAEMIKAAQVAQEVQSQITLADRDIKTTLKRSWSSLGFLTMAKLFASMIEQMFSREEIKAEEIERLKSSDALEELMREFSDKLPGVRTALIDERDLYLAHKIKNSVGQKVVAVVGAGHVPGIKKSISQDIDIAALEVIPPPGVISQLLSWGIPALVIALIIYGFFSHGFETSQNMILVWCLVNGLSAALGAAIALSHPITVLLGFLVAPFTAIHPLLSSGMFTGLCEAFLRKPTVADLESIADDIMSIKGIYRNRVSKVLLVFVLTNLFGSLGAILGIRELLGLI